YGLPYGSAPVGYGGQAQQPMGPPAMPDPRAYAPQHPQPGPMTAGAILKVYYSGSTHGGDKDRFIIGRGKQSSDLVIKDPNVSRQHAMVEYLNGVYYLVDMGSTNGVEFAGERITRRAISEGDIYTICGHEIRFTYRG